MKLVHITCRFEFEERIEALLEERGVTDYARYPMVEGRSEDGRHQGSQVHPGHMSVVQALVAGDAVSALLEDLGRFRQERRTHRHLRAAVLDVEQMVGADEEDNGPDGPRPS